MILIGWLTIVNTNVTVYLLLRIVNLTPAERTIETDLGDYGRLHFSTRKIPTAAAALHSCDAKSTRKTKPQHQFTSCSPGTRVRLAGVQLTPPQVDK
jgi:hypothetical protein